jgi:hypothetical protein
MLPGRSVREKASTATLLEEGRSGTAAISHLRCEVKRGLARVLDQVRQTLRYVASPWPSTGRNMADVDEPSLSRTSILATLDEHADELRRLGARSLALFGSLARGEGSDSSDIDFLVELEPKTFDAYMDVKMFLEGLLGRKVDLVLADAIKPRLRSVILAEAVHASRL